MDNHFHRLLEVPPMADGELAGEELLKRLSAIYSVAFVAGVEKELGDAERAVYTSASGMDEAVEAIHKRLTYRMQDLGEFMKGLLQRFTHWFNRAHSRSGTLWEDRFKSVIVEDGVAAKTISALSQTTKNTAEMLESEDNETVLKDLAMAKMLRC